MKAEGKVEHPLNIPKWEGTLEELAQAVENMRYDKTAEFLKYLAQCFRDRSKTDKLAGKLKLHNALYNVYTRTDVAAEYTKDAWKICEPHMPPK